MEPDVLFLSTHRLRKEAESLLQGRALGSALPVFTTAILGGPLPQSLLPYFRVFECCSQTTAVLLKAEPKQATGRCSSLLPTPGAAVQASCSPSVPISTLIHELHRALDLHLPRCLPLHPPPPPPSRSQNICCLLATSPLPILHGELLPHEIALGPSSLHSGGSLFQNSCDSLRLRARIKNKYQLPFLS